MLKMSILCIQSPQWQLETLWLPLIGDGEGTSWLWEDGTDFTDILPWEDKGMCT